MPRYESYKQSEVPWLGNVPSHWDVQPLRAVTSLKSDKNRPDLPVLSVYREYGVILKDSRDDNHNATSLDTSTYKVVKPGDLVVNKMKAWQGSMGVSSHHGIVSPAYITCTTKADRVRPAYLHYLLRSSPLIGVYNSLSYGVRVGQWDMHYEDFKQIQIPLPPNDEQDRIVAFLDQKTAEIDAAIAKKERLIELLDEQKSILINSLVTKGANPQAVTKASGLSWGGDIPAHWKIRYLKHLFRETDSRTSNGEEPLFSLRMSGHLLRHNDVSDKPITPDQLIGYKIVSPGQLVMNRMRASIGLFAVAHERGLVSPDYAVFDCIDDISQAYFLALFRNSAIRGVFLTESKGLGTGSSGFLRLYSDRFGGIKVPCPPREEQEKIVLAINDHFLKFADVERSAKIEIEKLTVMRSILIADAVTGKMRV
ncbi:MAG: restriction endonuclease subunit S [Methyloversatilis sp.]|uniref:restriction endonuclease subunit S n=1 Tax=Methyloversatilis sp. TaxID=2569862 RepID=UPI0025D38127|nr:restriction endonuclease subunit S [Methyloversatilis sp.]MCR6667803.1 restriction endonuclease subunit S [Methyloversatilis sp.]